MEILMVGVFMLAIGVCFCFGLLKWNGIRYSKRKGLPPGTMGWPVFGETTEFLKQGPDFMKNKRSRDFSYRLMTKTGESAKVWKCFQVSHTGQPHNCIHGSRAQQMALFIAFKQIMEIESSSIYEAFKAEFDKLIQGTLSLPINIPGTNYHRGFLGRKSVLRILREILEKRRNSLMKHDDMLEHLLKEDDPRYKLNEEEILDQVIMILYSGFETVSTTSMMAIKYLHDHPSALQELRDEHFAIRERKKPEEPIDWNDYKSMSFTRAVIFETSRLATVVNGVLRKTTEEMEFNGFVIPRGWKIYVYTREINYDPFLYPEPLKFNPWRWLDRSLESHNYCFLFGGGSRLCPGKELGIVTIATFLHYFVTRYRWEEVGGEKILKFPRVEAPNGLHMRVSKY